MDSCLGAAGFVFFFCTSVSSNTHFCRFAGPPQLLGCFIPVPFLGFSLVFMVVYIWSRHNSTQIVPILWFAIPAPWLPYFLALLSLMLGGSPTIDLMGILVGHLYYSFREVLPKYLTTSHETTWLPTPAFLSALFPLPS